MEEKTMHLANFNITFGEKAEPMLSHFEDIIFPAFISNYRRGKDNEYPVFLFKDVHIKKSKDGEYVLVGNYIKETRYTIHTTIKNGELTASPAKVPTAPYSRFIIFLKNHRMVLVRNESVSPDIRSFQATMRYVLNRYIREANKKKENGQVALPYAIVNIVDLPLEEDIELVLKNVTKIKWVKLRFFPTNNDLNPLPVASAIRGEMQRVGSNTANAQFNSPDSKQGIQKMLVDTAGLATTTMLVENEDGETEKIKESSFSSNKKIPFSRDITSEDDEHFILTAKKDSIISVTSKENKSLYEKCCSVIQSLMS